MRKNLLTCGLIAVTILICLAPAHAEDSFQRFRERLIDYFEAQGFFPVLINRDYRLGDVVDVDGVNLYARSTRCFPTLKTPPPTPATLTDVVSVDSAGMSWGLRLKKVFGLSGAADLDRHFQISFSDVSIVSVAVLDLRDALDRTACPEIAPLVDGTLSPLKPGEKPFFVISEILSGKRQAHLEFANRANMAAQAEQLGQMIGDATLAAKASSDGSVVLTNNMASPIAIKPLTVPHVVQIAEFQNGVRGGDTASRIRWQPVDCTSPEACIDEVGDLAEQMKAAPLILSPAELDQ